MKIACAAGLVLVLLVGANTTTWGDSAAVTILEAGEITPPWSGGKRRARLELDLVLLAESGWRIDELATMIDSIAGIYAQCGIHLAQVRWRQLRVPERWRDFSTSAARQLIVEIDVARPAAFLVRDTRQRPAFDAEAIGEGNSRTRPELRDTVWLTRALPHPAVGLAHELAHVLSNSGAHDERPDNLMRPDSAPSHTRLEADQCQAVLRSPLLERASGVPAARDQQ